MESSRMSLNLFLIIIFISSTSAEFSLTRTDSIYPKENTSASDDNQQYFYFRQNDTNCRIARSFFDNKDIVCDFQNVKKTIESHPWLKLEKDLNINHASPLVLNEICGDITVTIKESKMVTFKTNPEMQQDNVTCFQQIDMNIVDSTVTNIVGSFGSIIADRVNVSNIKNIPTVQVFALSGTKVDNTLSDVKAIIGNIHRSTIKVMFRYETALRFSMTDSKIFVIGSDGITIDKGLNHIKNSTIGTVLSHGITFKSGHTMIENVTIENLGINAINVDIKASVLFKNVHVVDLKMNAMNIPFRENVRFINCTHGIEKLPLDSDFINPLLTNIGLHVKVTPTTVLQICNYTGGDTVDCNLLNYTKTIMLHATNLTDRSSLPHKYVFSNNDPLLLCNEICSRTTVLKNSTAKIVPIFDDSECIINEGDNVTKLEVYSSTMHEGIESYHVESLDVEKSTVRNIRIHKPLKKLYISDSKIKTLGETEIHRNSTQAFMIRTSIGEIVAIHTEAELEMRNIEISHFGNLTIDLESMSKQVTMSRVKFNSMDINSIYVKRGTLVIDSKTAEAFSNMNKIVIFLEREARLRLKFMTFLYGNVNAFVSVENYNQIFSRFDNRDLINNAAVLRPVVHDEGFHIIPDTDFCQKHAHVFLLFDHSYVTCDFSEAKMKDVSFDTSHVGRLNVKINWAKFFIKNADNLLIYPTCLHDVKITQVRNITILQSPIVLCSTKMNIEDSLVSVLTGNLNSIVSVNTTYNILRTTKPMLDFNLLECRIDTIEFFSTLSEASVLEYHKFYQTSNCHTMHCGTYILNSTIGKIKTNGMIIHSGLIIQSTNITLIEENGLVIDEGKTVMKDLIIHTIHDHGIKVDKHAVLRLENVTILNGNLSFINTSSGIVELNNVTVSGKTIILATQIFYKSILDQMSSSKLGKTEEIVIPSSNCSLVLEIILICVLCLVFIIGLYFVLKKYYPNAALFSLHQGSNWKRFFDNNVTINTILNRTNSMSTIIREPRDNGHSVNINDNIPTNDIVTTNNNRSNSSNGTNNIMNGRSNDSGGSAGSNGVNSLTSNMVLHYRSEGSAL